MEGQPRPGKERLAVRAWRRESADHPVFNKGSPKKNHPLLLKEILKIDCRSSERPVTRRLVWMEEMNISVGKSLPLTNSNH